MYTIQGSEQNHYGPVQLAEVLRWIQNGRANAHTLVLKQGETDWKPLSEHSEFADALAAGASPNMQSQIADGQRPRSPKVFGIINSSGYKNFIFIVKNNYTNTISKR